LADTASQRPLWTTLGAALATVVVILGVAAGPTIFTCANSADGFGVCINGKLGDIGLSPQGSAPVSAPIKSIADTPNMDADGAAGTAAEVALPDVPKAAEASIAPRLGLVRAEPDGSLVIAGSAAPGAVVEIYANGSVLGRATTESNGDWVFVPDTTLSAGGVEISVAVPDTGELATESVVVVIQDDLKTEPLVVASTPGEASKILQGLPMPKAVEDAPPMLTAAVVAETETAQMANAESAMAVQDDEPAMAVPDAEAEPAVVDRVAVVTTPVNAMAEVPAGTALGTPPSIDAVEVEGSRNFFAGGGSEGATVRLYIDDQFIADSIVRDGRWLIETSKDHLTTSRQRIRVDMLETGTANVVGRAEVDFEILGTQPDTAVAAADDAAATINTMAAETQADTALASAPELGGDSGAETVPTMTAVQVGDPDDQRFASGKAIIRGGDNLWSIASRVYGSGYRYTTIYRANSEQIRNPDLIYPGQVFELPDEE